MQGTQLELQFDAVLREAVQEPETADLRALWGEFEQIIIELPDELQLQIAGKAIAQLAELLQAKAERWLNPWSVTPAASDLNEPVLTTDMLAGVLRQSMALQLDELLKDSPRRGPEAL